MPSLVVGLKKKSEGNKLAKEDRIECHVDNCIEEGGVTSDDRKLNGLEDSRGPRKLFQKTPVQKVVMEVGAV